MPTVGKEFNIFSGDRITLNAEPGKLTITADAQVEDSLSTSHTLAPSGNAVTEAIQGAKDYTNQKVASIVIPVTYKGLIDNENQLPSDTAALTVGSFYEIKNLNNTANGFGGRAIWNGSSFDIIADRMRMADTTTINFRTSDNALQIHPDVMESIRNKVDKEAGSRLITAAEITKLQNVSDNGGVASVAGKTGAVTLDKADVGLDNVDNTSDANKPISTATQAALNNKVDSVPGKQLSTEDYTAADKAKLTGITEGAQPNQNAYSIIKLNETAINAANPLDTFTFVAGDDIIFDIDAVNKKVTIKANRAAIVGSSITAIKVNGVAI